MMTLSQLAKKANVSVSTASKAFSGSPEVNDQTREQIFSIAKRYGCFSHFYKAKYPKLVIAMIAPEFNSAYYARYLSAIKNQLEDNDCELCVSTTDFSEEKEQALLAYYYRHANVDGIIIVNGKTVLQEPYEIPVIHLSPLRHQPHCPSITCRFDHALEQSIGYLKSKNVSAIGFIGEALTLGKKRMFAEALAHHDLPCQEAFIRIASQRFEAGGYAAMEALFAANQLPRAIICAYDDMAIGAIRCICDHNLRVPEDIAVMGINDIPQAAYLNPPLATISFPVNTLCCFAVNALLHAIQGTASPLPTEIIETEFLFRRSFEIDES